MSWHMLRLEAEVEFPAGVAPGAGRDGNNSYLSRDGSGRPVLRGSALAGVLRTNWRRGFARPEADLRHWFGHAAGDGAGTASRIVVEDVILGDAGANPERRTHNAIDRHSGAPVRHGLFTLESLGPGTHGRLRIVLRVVEAELEEARTVLGELLSLLQEGMIVGGGGSRGIGLMRSREQRDPAFRHFVLNDLADHADWLDERRTRTSIARVDGPVLTPAVNAASKLMIEGFLSIPRGQDILIGGDSGLDAAIEPQRIAGADGTRLLRFPGSSLRGVMRKWVARLAAREGRAVADHHARAVERQRPGTVTKGDELGWGFEDGARRAQLQADPSRVECPVMRLFGSLYARGRIHVSDAVVPDSDGSVRRRTHVSIDRVGGGASNGFLFNADVVCKADRIPLRISIDQPSDDESRWIACTLRAMHLGVLRVGSSKAAGRFEIADLRARGPGAEHFENIANRGEKTHG